MKYFIQFVITALLLATVLSCKKYEEGPNFTLRTAKARLTGTWEVTKFGGSINYLDNDSADALVHNDCGDTVNYLEPVKRTFIIEFKRNGTANIDREVYGDSLDFEASRLNCTGVFYPFSGTDNYTGTWEFREKKDMLVIPSLYKGYEDVYDNYNVLKLTNREMILKRKSILLEMKKK